MMPVPPPDERMLATTKYIELLREQIQTMFEIRRESTREVSMKLSEQIGEKNPADYYKGDYVVLDGSEVRRWRKHAKSLEDKIDTFEHTSGAAHYFQEQIKRLESNLQAARDVGSSYLATIGKQEHEFYNAVTKIETLEADLTAARNSLAACEAALTEWKREAAIYKEGHEKQLAITKETAKQRDEHKRRADQTEALVAQLRAQIEDAGKVELLVGGKSILKVSPVADLHNGLTPRCDGAIPYNPANPQQPVKITLSEQMREYATGAYKPSTSVVACWYKDVVQLERNLAVVLGEADVRWQEAQELQQRNDRQKEWIDQLRAGIHRTQKNLEVADKCPYSD